MRQVRVDDDFRKRIRWVRQHLKENYEVEVLPNGVRKLARRTPTDSKEDES